MKNNLIIITIFMLLLIVSCDHNGPEVENNPPSISSLTANPDTVEVNEIVALTCVASDPDGDELYYNWESYAGLFSGNGSSVTWTAPNFTGTFPISCKVDDGNDGEDLKSVNISVLDTQLRLKIIPNVHMISIDDIVTYYVEIENVIGLFAFSGEIVFDNTKITIPNNPVTIGNIWNDDIIFENINEPGCINICIVLKQTEDEDRIDGDGLLFSFNLKGIASGESDIVFENLNMYDENGELIIGFENIEISNGQLIIY